MKNETLTVAQIGCGAFAETSDFPNLTDNPRTELKWCCDIDGERATAMAKRFKVPNVTTNVDEVLADPDLDMIKIATSHEVHLPIISAAAARGVHVFCEKPMALDDAEAYAIIRAVRAGGVKLCVDFNRRAAPALIALRDKWLAHRADPKHQPWRYIERDRAPFPEETRTQFLVRVQDESSSYRLVHLDPLKGGGALIGETVHLLDLACWFFAPVKPVEVVAWGSPRFSHGVNVTFANRDQATIIFNCSGTFDYPKELFEVTSEAALLRSEFFVENTYHGIPGTDRETFPLARDSHSDVGQEGGLAGYLEKYAARTKGSKNVKHAKGGLNVDKGHAAMLDEFVQAILDDGPSPCDEIDGLTATHLARLAIQSTRLRQALPVAEEALVPCLV